MRRKLLGFNNWTLAQISVSCFYYLGLGLGVQEKKNWSSDNLLHLSPDPSPNHILYPSSVLFFLHKVLAFLDAEGLEKAGNQVCTCPEVRHIIKASKRKAAFSSHLGHSSLSCPRWKPAQHLSRDQGVPACQLLSGLQRQQTLSSLFGAMKQSSVFAAVVCNCQVAKVYFMYCKVVANEKFHQLLNPMDSTSAVLLQFTLFFYVLPGSPGQVQLLGVPLTGLDILTLADVQLQLIPRANGLILLLGESQFHLIESQSWKLSSKSHDCLSCKDFMTVLYMFYLLFWSVTFQVEPLFIFVSYLVL